MLSKLLEQIALGEVTGLDLRGQSLSGIDFRGSKIVGVAFDESTLECCNFDGCRLERCSFRKCVLINCRFRKAHVEWSDFRYAEINKATFEDAAIEYCDWYRAMLDGVVIMRNAKIFNCSLYYTSFGSGVLLHRGNFIGGKILQEDKEAYREFLVEWNTRGCGERKNDMKTASDWSPNAALQSRWHDAEDIYKTLSGYWQQIGMLSDSNWAYVKGRQMERRRMMIDIKSAKWYMMPLIALKIVINALLDLCFGFGESMTKMIITYICLIVLFAFIFSSQVDFPTWIEAFKVSLLNMTGAGSDSLSGISPFVDMLNVLQTTLGILLTGIFGFILGNKIRNQ